MSVDWERLFCDLDGFCRGFEAEWRRHLIGAGRKQRVRDSGLSLSEVMTLIIAFHLAHFRNFKPFYTDFIARYHRAEFPRLVSYSRFVELMPDALLPLCVFLNQRCGPVTGLSFIDATSLIACHPKRAHAHRVLDDGAAWGKTSVGWFYGFKLHLVISDAGELLAFKLTPGNTTDVNVIPLCPQVVQAFGTDKPFNLLLRPDNYIGLISTESSLSGLSGYLNELIRHS